MIKHSLLITFWLLNAAIVVADNKVSAYPLVRYERTGVKPDTVFNRVDSLLQALKTTKADTSKIKTLNTLSETLMQNGIYDSALTYANQALDMIVRKQRARQSLKKKRWLKNATIYAYNNIGAVYTGQGNYPLALKNFSKSLEICEQLGNRSDVARLLSNIGIIYINQGNYPLALKNFLKSLEIFEQLGDRRGTAKSYNRIGLIYTDQGDYPQALQNHTKSLEISKELSDLRSTAVSYNNIGLIYYDQAEQLQSSVKANQQSPLRETLLRQSDSLYNKALKNHTKSLEIAEQLGDRSGIASSYSNIGIIYTDQGDYPLALENHFRSLEIREQIGDKLGIDISYTNIGDVYLKQGKYKKAEQYYYMSTKIAAQIGDMEGLMVNYEGLSKALGRGLGEWHKANEYYMLYTTVKDSLFNEQKSRQITEMQTKYETVEKEKKIELLMKEQYIRELKLNKQRIIIVSSISALILATALAFVAYNRYRVKQKANTHLEQQNQHILQQNEEIRTQQEEILVQKERLEATNQTLVKKNKQITDSINYAKRIQEAILPPDDIVKKLLPDSFIFFKPRDIVSGDFYWLTSLHVIPGAGKGRSVNANEESPESLPVIPRSARDKRPARNDNTVILAAIDCTGHGVPGAFMSMISNTLLNEIVNEKGVTNPADILDQLNQGIRQALHQTPSPPSHRAGSMSTGHRPPLTPSQLELEKRGIGETERGKTKRFTDSPIHPRLPAPREDLVGGQAFTDSGGLRGASQAGRGDYIANDGMDLSLVAIQPGNAGGVRSLQFAGAQRPLYLITNGQLKKIKGNIDTIGGTRKRFVKSFTNHELKLKKGDTFYLFSDGYTDQFGGPDNERFMTARFQQLLLKINHLPMKKQHNILEKTFEEWKGSGKQTDDILVMGIRA
ncbi:MAG: tetratricopeptide repeat protein [Cytophagales bacterium]|nr:tetratricopeptide repeat protein [Cytophagales bacterium]